MSFSFEDYYVFARTEKIRLGMPIFHQIIHLSLEKYIKEENTTNFGDNSGLLLWKRTKSFFAKPFFKKKAVSTIALSSPLLDPSNPTGKYPNPSDFHPLLFYSIDGIAASSSSVSALEESCGLSHARYPLQQL